MGYRRLFIVRKDLNLSKGKMSAQIAHCAEAYWTRLIRNELKREDKGYKAELCFDESIVNEYINGSFVKTVCQAKNKNQLLRAGEIAKSLGLKEGYDYGFIYDNCLTELTPEEEDGTCLTTFWTAPLPDETAHQISHKYHLYVDNN